jgi:uncharacterized membrane protein YccC
MMAPASGEVESGAEGKARMTAQSTMSRPGAAAAGRLGASLRTATPALLYGLRLWASVCLALFVAFRLELENPSWAATSAAIMCQPSLGASLRKGGFRLIGTLIGAVAIVAMTAAFPQSRIGFLAALALWLGVCGFMAAILRNFAGYAAALAGYTAAIVFADATGDPGSTFILAVTRASEICLGIACAGVVLATTDTGTARRRLGAQFAALVSATAAGMKATLRAPNPDFAALQVMRRGLVLEAAKLDPVIDEAVGEASELRARSTTLQRAVDGLLSALSGWRNVANHLQTLEAGGSLAVQAETQIAATASLPLWDIPSEAALQRRPDAVRTALVAHVRHIMRAPAPNVSARLVADRTAEALLGLGRAIDGLVLLEQPAHARNDGGSAWPRVPDYLPAVLSGVRAVLAIVALEIFWVATAWQGGQLAVTFAAVGITLFSPREEAAYMMAVGFTAGAVLTTTLAGLVQFAVLPALSGFGALCVVLGVVLVPLAALSTTNWQKAMVTGMVMNFMPLLAPSNPAIYDPAAFLNNAMGIVVGTGVATLSFRLLPPLSARVKIARLHALTRADFRRLAGRRARWRRGAWEARLYGRILALPDSATMLDSAQLLAILSAGEELLRLRGLALRFGLSVPMRETETALAQGRIDTAKAAVWTMRGALETRPEASETGLTRAMASVDVLAETLSRHGDYLGMGIAL